MKKLVKENTWLSRSFMDFGWGNGYVVLPKGHKYHGFNYDDIPVDVHGGLTFSELVDEELIKNMGLSEDDLGAWIIGFDTCHHRDTLKRWPKLAVEKETENLYKQLL